MVWSVFLSDETLPIQADVLGRFVRAAIGGVVFDHVRHIKMHYGWIARNLDESQADAIVAHLREESIAVFKKAEDGLVQLDRKLHIHKGALVDDGLHAEVDVSGGPLVLPWPELTVVSIGSVPEVQKKEVRVTKKKIRLSLGTFLVTGLPLLTTKTTTTRQVEIREEGVLVDLIYARVRCVIRIRPRQFSYAYLGERLGETSRENFPHFLDDLARLGARSYWTRISRAFVESGELKPYFRDESDFFHHNLWITQIARDRACLRPREPGRSRPR